MNVIKECLNCKGNWEICKGYHCISWDGVCCSEFNSKDMENNSFGYRITIKD